MSKVEKVREGSSILGNALLSLAGYLISAVWFKRYSFYVLLAGILLTLVTLMLLVFRKDDHRQLARTQPASQWDWADYTQDVFNKIIWRWKYRLDLDDTPRDITPICPYCDRPLKWSGSSSFGYHYECSCGRRFLYSHQDADTSAVQKLILKKIASGSWRSVVERNRRFRQP